MTGDKCPRCDNELTIQYDGESKTPYYYCNKCPQNYNKFPTTKYCPTCKRTIDLFTSTGVLNFYRHRGRKGGFAECAECGRNSYRRRAKEDYYRIWAKNTRWQHTYGKSKKKRIFAISLLELWRLAHATPLCTYCGIPIAWETRGDGGTHRPTLDAYTNERTLTIHNVRIACKPCNSGKDEGTYEEYVNRCKSVVERYKDPAIRSQIQSSPKLDSTLTIEVNRSQCLRCGHQWVPRTKETPSMCPKCKSRYWNGPKVKKS